LLAGSLAVIDLDLPRNELQAITYSKVRFGFDRVASVAAMQGLRET
jgi:hypothetical protein